jgi:hypothetical protein
MLTKLLQGNAKYKILNNSKIQSEIHRQKDLKLKNCKEETLTQNKNICKKEMEDTKHDYQ